MKHILTHILAVFILLFFAGSRLLDVAQITPQTASLTQVSAAHHYRSLKAIEHKISKESHANYSSPSVEMDSSDLELSEAFVVLSPAISTLVFAVALGFFADRLQKRRFFYKAYIRMFSRKYVVLRTLRI